MAPPNEGSPPPHQYASVYDYEQPTSASRLIPRSARASNTSYPATGEEQQRSPQQHTANLRDSDEGRSISRRLAVAVVCGLAFLAGSGLSWSASPGSQSTAVAADGFIEVPSHTGIPAEDTTQPGEPSSQVSDRGEDFAALEFTALNFYHVRDGKPGQDYPWLKDVKLIEPHRDTTLAVVGAREGFDYRWEVRSGCRSCSGGVGEVQTTATGAVTIVVLTQLHENVVVLEEVDGDGRVTNRMEETVMVKYVRREIRTLTEDEREEVLDAVSWYRCTPCCNTQT